MNMPNIGLNALGGLRQNFAKAQPQSTIKAQAPGVVASGGAAVLLPNNQHLSPKVNAKMDLMA